VIPSAVRIGAFTAALLLTAVLSACTAGPGSVPSDPPTASAAPSPSDPAPASPTASEPAQTVGLSTDGIGPYLLGGSFEDARLRLGVPDAPAGEDRCPWFASAGDPQTLMTYVIAGTPDGVTADDEIISVSIQGDGSASDSPTTAEGVGLGSSEADVAAAYPDATADDVLNSDSALRVTEGSNAMVFQFRDGAVHLVTVLPASEPVPAEYCG
jgi:hypothetical protein